jgi:hypothetical protein
MPAGEEGAVGVWVRLTDIATVSSAKPRHRPRLKRVSGHETKRLIVWHIRGEAY